MNNLTSITDDVTSHETLIEQNITKIIHRPVAERLKAIEDIWDSIALEPDAKEGWNKTTAIAQVDWVHWVESAKQEKTRTKRIAVACDKLSSGKLRVCCFDPSGFYDKSKSAPEAVD